MNPASTLHPEDERRQSLSIEAAKGVVASVSARTIVAAMPAEMATKAGLSVGSLLLIDGNTRAIAAVRGVETPAANIDAKTFELVLIEAELCGRVATSGCVEPQIACPAVGSKVSLLNIDEALLRREGQLHHKLLVGSVAGGAVSVDANQLLPGGIHLSGAPLSTASTLAVLLRGLLRSGFPARLVLLDPDALFTESFGAAASLVDVSAGLAAPGFLTASEIADALEACGEPLLHEERMALHAVAKGQGGPLSELISALDGLQGADLGAKSLIRRLTDARRDPRYQAFFGEVTDHLTSEDVLQTFFRLPDGRPPMALCQMNTLDPALRPVAASFLVRMAKTLSNATAGRVPVVVAAHRSDRLGLERVDPTPYFGLISAARSMGPLDGMTLLHPGTVLSDEDDWLELSAAQLQDGEAVLVDPSLPWPQRFEVEVLPERAVPGGQTGARQPNADIRSLMETVNQAFGG